MRGDRRWQSGNERTADQLHAKHAKHLKSQLPGCTDAAQTEAGHHALSSTIALLR
jgi:hypothetical protein